MRERRFHAAAAAICALIIALGSTARAQDTAISASAHELVQRAVQNELKASESNSHYMYLEHKQTPQGSSVKQVAETQDGEVSYLLKMNDQPLSADQRRIEDDKMQKLLNDPNEQRRRLKNQKDDERRATTLVRALPDAFVYEFDQRDSGDPPEVVKLKFHPNPNYNPPDRETQVLTGMAGSMYLDTKANRMKRLDGTLIDDVNFGWGIFGKLHKGSHFEICESDVADGHWDVTYRNLDFTGKVLIFKKLRIKETSEMSDFHKIPDNLSFTQGFDLLRKENQPKISAKR
ncbi:MAG: hypothetical protein ACJ71N_11365 [Terriglobales bacterium]|jgi:hypothetical protein